MNIFTRLNASAKTAGIFVAISKAISDGIGWIALTIGAFIKALKDSKGISYIIDTFVNGFKSLKEAMGGLITALKDSKFISTILGNIKRSFDSISTVNTKGLDDSTEKLKKLLESIKKAFGPLMDYIAERSELMRKRLEPVLNFIKDVFGKIRDYVSEKWDLMGFNGIIDIFKGLLGGGILLSLMQFVKNLSGLTRAIGDFGGIKSGFAGLFGGVQRTLLGLQNTLKAYQQNLKAKQLITIASAIAILVASLFILTLLDEKKMLAGIGVITALVVDLTASMILLKKFGGGIKGVGALLVMASAVLILTSALALLKDVDPNAIYALSVVLGELVLASILMGKVKKVSTANFLGMALSLTIIAGAVKIFGNMKIDQLKQGLMAVSILLGEMLVFSLVMGAIGKNAASILAAGISMGIIAIALLELTGVGRISRYYAGSRSRSQSFRKS